MRGEEVLVPIIFFIFLGGVIIMGILSRHRERITMIEKGLTSDEIKAMYHRDVRRNPLTSLKWGILFVLAGVAVMLGEFLHEQYNVADETIFGLVCLFVGIGLVLFYIFASNKLNQPR